MTSAIEVRGVGKRYAQLQESQMLIKSLLPWRRPRRLERWALRGLDLTVEPGETVGILGHNGAGKTTVLRLLAGVTRPTEGHVHVAGRVAPLISIGVGFHQEMSGRENILVNAMLLGLSRSQVNRRFDEIIDFSGIGDFIDTPVKFYSSGMYMRLGFSVAVHVDPQVMLVDEILAVGDIAFQFKCLERLRELRKAGTTILFVSHSMHAIRLICPRAILLRHGALEYDGPSESAIARHYESLSETDESTSESGGGRGLITVLSRRIVTPSGASHHPETGELVTYTLRVRFNADCPSPTLTFNVTSEHGIPCYTMVSRIGENWKDFHSGEETVIEIKFYARLGGGTYRLGISLTNRDYSEAIWVDTDEPVIYLAPRLGAQGLTDLESTILAAGIEVSDHSPLSIGTSMPYAAEPPS